MKQFLLLVLLVVSSMAHSQDYTPNLIDYTGWINAGSVGEPLTCWAPGDTGYCGPLPAVGAFNNPSLINFSYGLTDIYQPVDIAQALSAAGSGIIVNGFSFNFIAKNGNGWDNGQLDYLTAYAKFYNNNSLVESYNYDLNYRFNWTNFNYSETFTNPYQINDLDEVKVGFVGRDTNGWAGFYGPEVRNINFRLNYGIDPCYEDPLSSTSCAGFQEALLELQCNGDPLSSIDCPGYLENFMSEIDMNLDEVFEDEMYDEYSEEELYEDLEEEFFEDEFIADEEFFEDVEELLDDEEFFDEELIADEEFLDEELISDKEFLEDDLSDEESVLSLLELVERMRDETKSETDEFIFNTNTNTQNEIVEVSSRSENNANVIPINVTEQVVQNNLLASTSSTVQELDSAPIVLTDVSVNMIEYNNAVDDSSGRELELTEDLFSTSIIAISNQEEQIENIQELTEQPILFVTSILQNVDVDRVVDDQNQIAQITEASESEVIEELLKEDSHSIAIKDDEVQNTIEQVDQQIERVENEDYRVVEQLIDVVVEQEETRVEDIETIVDDILIAENDTEEELETIVAVSSSSNVSETNIETLLSDNTVQENNTETVVAATEQVNEEEETSVENIEVQEETNNNEETTNQSFDDIALISEISLDVVTTAASTFNNNSMQQVLALGGTITEILNTPVPDFSRYEVKPPSQEEEVQTAKVENTLESMSTEEIESQAEMRIGSMDPESQAIALQLIGYKPGFDQYGGMLVDQSNWYLDRGMYTNNRVPSSNSNLIFGAQDQRHQELMSLQYK
jgi:hypothetical protein